MRKSLPDQLPANEDCSLLAAALTYASFGWLVFPLQSSGPEGGCSCGNPDCKKLGKHPRTRHGFKDASTDAARIREWWKEWPDANIGIATGSASGIVVVDIDERHGGIPRLHQLKAKHGGLPLTWIVRTGNGHHLYFKHPGDQVKCFVGRGDCSGIDLRGDGGYVVAPPSLHFTGRKYKWDTNPEEAPLADLPVWLPTLLAKHPSRR